MKKVILLIILIIIGCSSNIIERKGYTVNQSDCKQKKLKPVTIYRLIPDVLIDPKDAYKIGQLEIECKDWDLSNYIAKEGCLTGANFFNIPIHPPYSAWTDKYHYTVDLYKARENSKTLNRFYTFDKDTLFYNSERQIFWNDFRGTPDEIDSVHNAMIFTNLVIQSNLINFQYQLNGHNFNITSVMFRSKSWVKPGKRKDNYLEYQKLMFLIAEYISKKLEFDLKNNNVDIFKEKEKTDSICNKHSIEMFLSQEKLDIESKYGRDDAVIKQWKENVSQDFAAVIQKLKELTPKE